MKARHLLLAASFLGILALLVFDRPPAAPALAEAAERRKSSTPARAQRNAGDTAILRLEARDTLIGGARASKGGEGLFAGRSWAPAPAPASAAAASAAAAPPAPPLPYTYLGKKFEDGAWEIFVAQAGQTHILRNGDTVDGAWRVDNIAPPQMTFTYVPLRQAYTLNIGRAD